MHNQTAIPLRLVMRTIIIAIVVLYVLNLFAQSAALSAKPSDAAVAFAELFTVNAHGKFPTWFASATLLLCAGLLCVIGVHESSARYRRQWLSLCGMLVLISVDEASALHEELSGYVHDLVPADAMLRSVWLLMVGIGAAILFAWAAPLLRSLPRTTRSTMLLAVVMYLGGTVGMELFVAAYFPATAHVMQPATHAVLATIDALLKMTGVAVLIFALLAHMRSADIPLVAATIQWRQIAALTACVVALLCAAGLAGQISRYEFGHGRLLGFVRLFNLDGEGNATSWFSSMLMLTAALACVACAEAERLPRSPRLWWILGAAFAAFSLDEFVSLHELSIAPLREVWHTSGFLRFPWVLGGMLVAGIFAALCAADLRRLPRRTAQLIVLSGAIFVTGAIGFEVIGAWWSSGHGEANLMYQDIVACEETLEMVGVGLFLCVLVRRLSHSALIIGVQQDKQPTAASLEATEATDLSRAA